MRTPAPPPGPVPPGSGRSDPSGSHQGGEPGPEPVDRELQAHPEHVEGPDEGRLVLGGSEPVDGDGHGAPLAGITQFELTRSYQAYRGPLPSPADFSGFEQVLPGAANRILRMAEQRQRAEIENQQVIARAEARAFVSASWAVSFLPWVLAALTVGLLIAGESGAAAMTALGTAISAGPQIIAATRPARKQGDKG